MVLEVKLRLGQWEGLEVELVVLVVVGPPEGPEGPPGPGGWAGPGSWRAARGNDNKTWKLSSYTRDVLKYDSY